MLVAPWVQDLAKRDLWQRHQLRPGFSRPGMLTAHHTATRPSVLARVWGTDLRRLQSLGDVRALSDGGATCVHIYDRETGAPITDDRAALVQDVLGLPLRDSQPGERVIDVICAPDEPTWAGLHEHDDLAMACPAGARAAAVPDDSPSRAFAKIEEAILWRGLDVRAGHRALEIGCAPGGAALALARRGLHVLGVDAGSIAPHVLGTHPGGGRVDQLVKKMGALTRDELPMPTQWLLIDVNVAPGVAIHEIQRFIPPLRDGLRGVIFTWKLNDESFVLELPRWEAALHEWNVGSPLIRHLPSNRREVCVVVAKPAACFS